MPIIQWQDNFSVNIAVIDQQHKKLVEMINQMHAAMSVGKGSGVLDEILSEMTAYCATHFATEESLFQQYSYPGTLSHQREHRNFVEKVNEAREKSERSKTGLSMEIITFLKEWLTNHILQSDMKYSVFMNKKGVR